MAKFESEVKYVPASCEAVYAKLSDLSHLEEVKSRLPEDKAKNLTFDADTLSVDVPSVGHIALQVVEREPNKCIKLASVASPMPFNMWIQMLPVADGSSKLKVTVGLELNAFMKAMVQKPLQEGVDKMAHMLTMIPY